MKLYTEKEVKKLLETQRGNCYVAVSNAVRENIDKKFSVEAIAVAAANAPQPAGEQFDRMYGIDVTQLIHEDLADKELQGNYDGFKRHLDAAKTSYNACVPTLNSMISKIVNLKELIVSLSVQGLSTETAVKRLAKLDNNFTKLSEKAEVYKTEIDKQKDLINKYEDWNERKLFMHWKYLSLLKAIDEPWMEFKKQYVDVMI
jgi:hypothetical protein